MNNDMVNDDTDMRALVQAAAWRTRLKEAELESSEAFEAWIAADPRNETAWRQVQGPWSLFGEHATAPELIEARREALSRARQASQRRWRSRSLVSAKAASVAAVLLVFVVGSITWTLTRSDVYRTALGERRVVTLSDGSRISLDSATAVQVRYSENARELRLAKGQARFDVARDVTRPFSVLAAEQKIIATGTAFNVDLIGQRVLVTLIEGHVVVLDQRRPRIPSSAMPVATAPAISRATPAARRDPPVELRAGEQLVVASTGPADVEPASIERATAWENGRLVFHNEPLSTVVARVSRYTDREIHARDERAARIRISGVFKTGDLDGFVDTLTHYLPLRATEGKDGAIELRPLEESR